jgi:predicted nucleotidyltransferase
MSLIEVVQSKRIEIERLAAKHGAANVRIFGSVLHGRETSSSDIDFLIDVVGRTSSWFPSGLALDLQDLLGRHVDVVTERSLHAALRERVLNEARPL